MKNNNIKYDALVVGAGITGLQSAIDLADQGYQVLMVEKEPSIGGKMIALSKVFPTLDCSSCICTPKMAAAAHHPNITIMTYAEVLSCERKDKNFVVRIKQKPRYIKEDACTGCRLCEYACPVIVPHEFEGYLGARKAIHVPFSNAMPQLALLDVEHCMFCGKCEQACPPKAIDYLQEPIELTHEVGTVILSTGYRLTAMDSKIEYGAGKLINVLDALQVERLIAPHGPYGHVLRPSDGKTPDSVAYIQCAGSRDVSLNIPYCSRVCCMYAIKQAMLLAGNLPLVDITIYYIDIRAFGKGFEQFYQNAKAMGIEFVKAKVAEITEDKDKNPVVKICPIDEQGTIQERKHDMVVLTQGIIPALNPKEIFNVDVAKDNFIKSKDPAIEPCCTSEPGIFMAGAAMGPKDIPDSILDAGAAALEASVYLKKVSGNNN